MSHTQEETVRFTTQVGARGRLVLPAAVRKRLALNEGDRVVLTLEPDGSMRLVGLKEQVSKVRGLYRNVAPDVDLVSELIRERRDEGRRKTEP